MTNARELTFRGLALGTLITLVFTAANVYLGLKIGLTISSSIPAAMISMSLLRLFRHGSILENNIVQTQASAAVAISCVFATLPAFIVMGYWHDFPYWPIFICTAAGGIAGVIFTVPLRRALVNRPDLPFPEGVACAEILAAGASSKSSRSLRLLSGATLFSAVFTFLTTGLKWLASGFVVTRTAGRAIYCIQGAYSTALLGIGCLVGISSSLAMLSGVAIAWLLAVPILTSYATRSSGTLLLFDEATRVWADDVRYLGAGTIAIAALWTLAELVPGVIDSIKTMLSEKGQMHPDRTERDLSPRTLLIIGFGVFFALFQTFNAFLPGHGVSVLILAALSVIFCLLLSFLVAAACGYMAGMVGASSSPISGVMIVAIIVICLLFKSVSTLHILADGHTEGGMTLIIAFTLFILTALTASAAISNDNLQDLKTGQIVKATPWKQQVALMLGCIAGAAVTPPVLDLLHRAYGFFGEAPVAPGDAAPLAAPQATLMLSLARGILNETLDWTMFALGAAIGLSAIIFEKALKRKGLAFPSLAIGMGIYLPPEVSVTIAAGGLITYLATRKNKSSLQEAQTRPATMIASGFIVGESLIGIVIAALNVTQPTLLESIPIPNHVMQNGLGIGAFALAAIWLYRRAADTAH